MSISTNEWKGINLPRSVAILNIGTTLEWYDFVIAGTAAALVWPYIFFPTSVPGVGLVLSFTVFGIGFLGRPIGSIVFGHIGDKIGRKTSLILTLTLMGIASLGVALVPGYDVIGFIAPVLITIFRLLEGFGIGGEWGGAATALVEYTANRKNRGFWTSWIQQGLQFGVILGDGLGFIFLAYFGLAGFIAYAWRYLFYIGFAVSIVGAIFRYTFTETPIFKKMFEQKKVVKYPFIEMWKKDWKKVLIMVGIWLQISASFYIAITFSEAYIKVLGFSSSFALMTVIIGAAATIIVTLLAAMLSDRVQSRKKIMLVSPIFIIPYSFIFFILMDTRSAFLIVFAVAIYYAFELFGWSVVPTFYAEYSPPQYRYTATAFSLNLSTAISGGIAPIIMSLILLFFKDHYLVAWPYLALVGVAYSVISLVALLFVKGDTAKKDLSKTDEKDFDFI